MAFTSDLRKFILTEIVSNEQYLPAKSMTKKELSIVLQLMMEVNTYEGKIERKKIMEGYRYLNRMKSIELIGENILWEIY